MKHAAEKNGERGNLWREDYFFRLSMWSILVEFSRRLGRNPTSRYLLSWRRRYMALHGLKRKKAKEEEWRIPKSFLLPCVHPLEPNEPGPGVVTVEIERKARGFPYTCGITHEEKNKRYFFLQSGMYSYCRVATTVRGDIREDK